MDGINLFICYLLTYAHKVTPMTDFEVINKVLQNENSPFWQKIHHHSTRSHHVLRIH